MQRFLLVLLLSLLPLSIYTKPLKFVKEIGVYGNMGLNLYESQFKYLPQYPSCCPNYKTGQGFGLNFGILGNYVLLDWLSVGGRLGYSDLSALISQDENKIVDNNMGTTSNGIIRHDLDVTLPAISIEPTATLKIIDNLKGFVGIGIDYVLSGDITQKETLIEPKNVTFENGKATRNEVAGSLDNINHILPFVSLGAYYDLPLNNDKDLVLSPTFNYKYGFQDVVQNVHWTISSINLGLQVRYLFKESEPEIKEVIHRDTIVPVFVPKPTSAITSNFSVQINEKFSSDTIFIKYDKDLRFDAILGYVFFDEGVSTIPSRYELISKKEAKDFSAENLKFENSLSAYHNILNVLGQRFKKFPDVKIDLVGCNSDYGIEQGDTALSRSRAEKIKDYFVNVWGLNPDRFTITSRNLPETPSNSDNDYGRAENRRVEIVPQDWTIFKPQVISDTTNSNMKDLAVSMHPSVQSKIPISSWEIDVSNNDGVKKKFNGVGLPPKVINWNPMEDLDELPTEENPLNFNLNVTDSLGTQKSFAGQITREDTNSSNMSFVQKIVNDTKTEKYNLILFGYNIAKLPPVAEVTLNLVKSRITDNTEVVSIEGYSDIIGDEDYNMQLSTDRAITVAKALGVSLDKAIGRGKVKDEVYDNELPEGRFYSRSVIVTLKEK